MKTTTLKISGMVLLLMALAGCWNDNRPTSIRLGDVSLGRQLIDLQEARDKGAISAAEYETLRAKVMEMGVGCGAIDDGQDAAARPGE